MDLSVKNRTRVEKIILCIKTVQGNDDDFESSNEANIEYIKQDVKEVIDYNRNTTTYDADGSIVITPHYFENFPNELLDKTLGYLCEQRKLQPYLLQNNLYQLGLVNKQFYQCVNRILWRAPYIPNSGTVDRFLTCLANTQIIQRSTSRSNGLDDENHHHYPVPHNSLSARHHIRQLDIVGEFWDNIQLSLIMPYVGLLEILNIKTNYGSSKLTDATLYYLPRYCPYLSTISLIPTMMKQPTCLDAIVQHCHQLCKLELYIHYNNQQQQGHIFKLLLSCPSLTILHLYCIHGDDDHSHLSENMILNIAKLHQLTSVAFINGSMGTTIKIFLHTIHTISTTIWPRLSSLLIHHAIHLTDAFMIPFIQSHPHIKSLDLDAARFSDSTLYAIATHLPHITHVRFLNNHIITSDGVYKLVRHCRDLKLADFSWCNKLYYSMTEFSELDLFRKASLTLTQMEKIRQRNDNN